MARTWSTAERMPEFNIVEATAIYGKSVEYRRTHTGI
jgi:hypothetical protein